MTPSRIEPATFRLVVQCLNQLCAQDLQQRDCGVGSGVPVNAMKACAEKGGTAPLILHLYTGWKQVFSLTPWPLCIRTGLNIQRYDGKQVHIRYRFGLSSVAVSHSISPARKAAKHSPHVSHSVSPARKAAKHSPQLHSAAPRLYWRSRCISEREMAAARSDPFVRVAPNWLSPLSSHCEEPSRSWFCHKTYQIGSSKFTEIGGQQMH